MLFMCAAESFTFSDISHDEFLTCRLRDYLFCYKFQGKTDQNQILDFAFKDHNLLIAGQAGVGKSEVVKVFVAKAKEAGKKIGFICSNGI